MGIQWSDTYRELDELRMLERKRRRKGAVDAIVTVAISLALCGAYLMLR